MVARQQMAIVLKCGPNWFLSQQHANNDHAGYSFEQGIFFKFEFLKECCFASGDK